MLEASFIRELCGISYLDITAVFVELTMTKSLKDDYVTEFGGDMIERVALVRFCDSWFWFSHAPQINTPTSATMSQQPLRSHTACWNTKPSYHTGTHQCCTHVPCTLKSQQPLRSSDEWAAWLTMLHTVLRVSTQKDATFIYFEDTNCIIEGGTFLKHVSSVPVVYAQLIDDQWSCRING